MKKGADTHITSKVSEKRRLLELERFEIMDTELEKVFDDLTRLAAAICEAPISLVSLVDDHRQWFKSATGLDAKETPRDQAFCAHAIQTPHIMVVPDATKDERFVDNPLVTGEPGIRFYAGAPLEVSDGVRLGTLCVIDREPRSLSKQQTIALATLRDAVVSQLELKRSLRELNTLRELVPMCAWCNAVKVEDGDSVQWQPLNEYVARHATLTHGVCPDCKHKLYS